MRLEPQPGGEVRQWFHHLFIEENDSVVEQTFTYVPKLNGVFELTIAGAPLTGRGYCAEDMCHYQLPIPGNWVEITHHFQGDGRIRVTGSSEKNSFGRYIWWEERLVLAKG
jgi:hypothetical protein